MSRRDSHPRPGMATSVRAIEARLSRGETVAQACLALGLHRATYYRWRRRLNGENGESRRSVNLRSNGHPLSQAEYSLLRSVARTQSADERRQAARWACLRFGLSQRVAARAFGVSRYSLSQRAALQAVEDPVVKRLRAVARQYPAYGYRFAWALLRREGHFINHKRVYRLWRRWVLPRRKATMPGSACRRRRVDLWHPHQCWSIDATRLTLASGDIVQLLAVIDDYSRVCLALDAHARFTDAVLPAALWRLFDGFGSPRTVRVDRGLLVRLKSARELLDEHAVRVICPRGKSPARNPFVESFFARLKQDPGDWEGLLDVASVQAAADRFRRHYNTQRPHSGLDYRTPAEALQAGLD